MSCSTATGSQFLVDLCNPDERGPINTAMTYLFPYSAVVSLLLLSACGNANSNQPDAGPVSCTTHDQCGSNVCLPDGSCSDGSNVAYVDPQGTDNPRCARETPCATLSSALGKQPYIKVSGTVVDSVTIVDKTVAILADPGAKITGRGPGSIIVILGRSQVAIFDLEISGATGDRAHGLVAEVLDPGSVTLRRVTISDCSGRGLLSNDSKIHISQSTIRNNSSGGALISAISASATAQFINNFVYRNGSPTSEFSGVVLFGGIGPADPSKMALIDMAFNTVVDNESMAVTGGLRCRGQVIASNNLIFRNKVPLPMTDPQVDGDCNVGASLLTAPEKPGFTTDYHLTDRTPAVIVDAVDCSPAVATDIDGDPRPTGSKCDLGADEYKP